MKLYSYVVTHDTGFAPNPTGRYCTLACCKPDIRRCAEIGDWVVGMGSVGRIGNDKLIYAMKVTEKMTFDEYYKDERFKNRIDNMYFINNGGEYDYIRGRPHGKSEMKKDLNGIYVLISDDFVYYGSKEPLPIINKMKYLTIGRKHRSKFTDEEIYNFVKWIRSNWK